MARGFRFFLYSQHLAGIGHFVRTSEIAKSLARRHEVYLVDGGRPVPHEITSAKVTVLSLPRICRGERGIAAFDSDVSVPVVMEKRLQILKAAIELFRPHVITIEHFPFRRWELFSEIVPLIVHARIIDKRVKIVGSFRDIPGSSRFDPETKQHESEVLQVLDEYFDKLLVHSDPRVMRLEEQIAVAGKFNIPLEYTGYVSQRGDAQQRNRNKRRVDQRRGTVIVSAGGTGNMALLNCAIDCWKLLVSRKAVGDRMLQVFLPLSSHAQDVAALQRRVADNTSIRLLPYSSDFLNCMRTADLSISHAGYNTCTNVLETRCRSILVPNLQMSDQGQRARRFAKRGLATTIDPADLTAERLATTVVEQLQKPTLQHDINLDGARITSDILEQICAEEPAAAQHLEGAQAIQAA
ncbi:MAG TPA: glycosyltransferase [Pirellulales bacterium]|nr:glycosyltransferase [Pirellulales bacterium]